MKYKTKSVIIGRKKREKETDISYPFFIAFFDINNPHTSGQVPKRIEEFPHVHKAIIKGLDVSYLLAGNDIIINDLTEIDVESVEGHIYLSGKQEKSSQK